MNEKVKSWKQLLILKTKFLCFVVGFCSPANRKQAQNNTYDDVVQEDVSSQNSKTSADCRFLWSRTFMTRSPNILSLLTPKSQRLSNLTLCPPLVSPNCGYEGHITNKIIWDEWRLCGMYGYRGSRVDQDNKSKRFPNKYLQVSRPLKSNEGKPNLKWQHDCVHHYHRCLSNTVQHQHVSSIVLNGWKIVALMYQWPASSKNFCCFVVLTSLLAKMGLICTNIFSCVINLWGVY